MKYDNERSSLSQVRARTRTSTSTFGRRFSLSDYPKQLNRHHSNISRELARNSYKKAQETYKIRRVSCKTAGSILNKSEKLVKKK